MTENIGYLRNDVRKDIIVSVSNLRKEFTKLKCEGEEKNRLIVNLEMKAAVTNNSLRAVEIGFVKTAQATRCDIFRISI